MDIIGGDFGETSVGVFATDMANRPISLTISKGLRNKPEVIPAGNVAMVDQVTDENKVSLLGAIGWGVAGTLIAGPIGTVIGGILGGRKSVITVLVTLEDGRRFLAVCSGIELKQLLVCSTREAEKPAYDPHALPENHDWSFLG